MAEDSLQTPSQRNAEGKRKGGISFCERDFFGTQNVKKIGGFAVAPYPLRQRKRLYSRFVERCLKEKATKAVSREWQSKWGVEGERGNDEDSKKTVFIAVEIGGFAFPRRKKAIKPFARAKIAMIFRVKVN